jgi:hypothetical protein
MRPTRRRPTASLGAFVVLAAVLAGCAADPEAPSGDVRTGATGTSDETDAAGDTEEDPVADRLRTALVAAGEENRAALLSDPSTTIEELDTPFLATWTILRVESLPGATPALFHAATDGDQALILTGRPEAFDELLATDGGAFGDEEAAIAAARTFADTTRPGSRFGQVVDDASDIRLRGSLDDAERDEAVAELEPLVRAPEVVAADGARTTVALTYLDGDVLQRREITVGDGGPVDDDVEVLAEGLPVPVSI